MLKETATRLQHSHDFALQNERGERRTRYVLWLTAITMVVEVVAGTVYGSMALLADGWHMGTHVAAFLIALFAYRFSRKHVANSDFSFGTGKVNVLGGFASAVVLAAVALLMLVESLARLLDPQTIQFTDAIAVASIGLAVNVLSAWLLKDDHHHDHDHDHDHDHNLRAAYMHVLADALTSVLAIAALVAGKYLGWHWLDPVMGIVGAVIITRWAYALICQTAPVLLDASIGNEYRESIRMRLEEEPETAVSDLHVWKISASHYAASFVIVNGGGRDAAYFRDRLGGFDRLAHVTVEVVDSKNA